MNSGPPAQHLFAGTALLPEGWRSNVRLTIKAGQIIHAESGARPAPGDERHGILLPGMGNLHSHAFQRGMAGLAERRSAQAESFWSWRDVMYRFALAMDPAQMQAVAELAYLEMLEAGFCRVGEFHYLHHDKDGHPYGNIAEMAERIAAAAATTGIGLTLLPVFYAHSTFGGAKPAEAQRRFINSPDSFAQLLEGCEAAVKPLAGAIVGVAPHSLRAVTPEQLAMVSMLRPGAPVHIHIAEQAQEVEDCLAWSGQRPVQWLLEHAPVDSRWCLIHATRMIAGETRRMAQSGAIAGLCPVTEANLGDGTFPAPDFLAASGSFGVGTDSNVLIELAGELRQLEYSQRLHHRARTLLAEPGGSTGRSLFQGALAGGHQALGAGKPGIGPGAAADFVSLDPAHPSLAGLAGDAILDAWIFAGGNQLVDCVWVQGRKQVAGGHHVAREAIARQFRAAMTALRAG